MDEIIVRLHIHVHYDGDDAVITVLNRIEKLLFDKHAEQIAKLETLIQASAATTEKLNTALQDKGTP